MPLTLKKNATQLRALSMSMTSSSDFKLIRGSVQIKTLDNQTYNILPVSLTMSLSIQLMINFKFSSGIQSNLVVGIYFTLNCMHCRCMRSAANAAPCTFDLHWFNTRELKMDTCISILSSCVLNQWRRSPLI